MTTLPLLALLGPMVSLLYSILFGGLWWSWKKERYLLLWSSAYLLNALGLLSQIFLTAPRFRIGYVLTDLFYLMGAIALSEGSLLRLHHRPLRLLKSFLVLLILGCIFYFSAIHDSLLARIYVLNFGIGFLLLIAAIQTGRAARKRIDWVLFWVLLIFALQFFPRTLLSLHGAAVHAEPALNATQLTTSAFWLWLNFTLVLFCILIGFTLVGCTVVDRIEDFRTRATTDALTGILNRRGLEEVANRLLVDPRSHPVHLILCDIDFFKRINDIYGHAIGDLVLRNFSRLILSHLRVCDSLGRIGGEEFAILLPGTSLEEAFTIAERLRAAVEQAHFVPGVEAIRITASFGVAQCKTNSCLSEVLRWADEGLYHSKRSGRNRSTSIETKTKGASVSVTPFPVPAEEEFTPRR